MALGKIRFIRGRETVFKGNLSINKCEFLVLYLLSNLKYCCLRIMIFSLEILKILQSFVFNFSFTNFSIVEIRGFSSITSISLWLLRIVSNKVVPDLGNPIKKVRFESSISSLNL